MKTLEDVIYGLRLSAKQYRAEMHEFETKKQVALASAQAYEDAADRLHALAAQGKQEAQG